MNAVLEAPAQALVEAKPAKAVKPRHQYIRKMSNFMLVDMDHPGYQPKVMFEMLIKMTNLANLSQLGAMTGMHNAGISRAFHKQECISANMAIALMDITDLDLHELRRMAGADGSLQKPARIVCDTDLKWRAKDESNDAIVAEGEKDQRILVMMQAIKKGFYLNY